MAKIHPDDTCEPRKDTPSEKVAGKTKGSSKRASKTKKKLALVDEDPYTSMSRHINQMTPLEKLFADAYVDNLSIIQAKCNREYVLRIAVDIGIESYNAQKWGDKAIKEPCVQQAINSRHRSRHKRLEITADRILAEYARIAFADIGDVVDAQFDVRRLDDMSEDARRSIGEVIKSTTRGKDTTTVNIKIKQHNKMEALKMLAQHEGLLDTKDNAQLSPQEAVQMALQAAQGMIEMTTGMEKPPEQPEEVKDADVQSTTDE